MISVIYLDQTGATIAGGALPAIPAEGDPISLDGRPEAFYVTEVHWFDRQNCVEITVREY